MNKSRLGEYYYSTGRAQSPSTPISYTQWIPAEANMFPDLPIPKAVEKARKLKSQQSQQQQSSQPIRKATPGYQPQAPSGKPYGFRNKSTGEWEWFSTMEEMNAAQKSQQVKQSILPYDPYRRLQNEISTLEKAKGISDPVKRNIFLQSKEMGGYRAKDLQAIEERIAQIKSRLPRKMQPTTPRTDLNYDPSKSSFSRAMQEVQNIKG
jgi:hypothetical protein